MALATRCPHCQTVFRIVPDQLKLHRGLVRCGHCREVFDGVLHQVEPPVRATAPTAPPPAPAAAATDTAAAERTAVESAAIGSAAAAGIESATETDSAAGTAATEPETGASDDRQSIEANHVETDEHAVEEAPAPTRTPVSEFTHHETHHDVTHEAAHDIAGAAEAADAHVADEARLAIEASHVSADEEQITHEHAAETDASADASAVPSVDSMGRAEPHLSPEFEGEPNPFAAATPFDESAAASGHEGTHAAAPAWEETFSSELPPGAPSAPFSPRAEFDHEAPDAAHVATPLGATPPTPIIDTPEFAGHHDEAKLGDAPIHATEDDALTSAHAEQVAHHDVATESAEAGSHAAHESHEPHESHDTWRDVAAHAETAEAAEALRTEAAAEPAIGSDTPARFGHEDEIIDVEPTSSTPHYGATSKTDPWAPPADTRMEPALSFPTAAAAAAAAETPFAPLADDTNNDFRIRVEPPETHNHDLHPARRILGWIVALLLLVLLVAQLAWWQREPIMAHWPNTVSTYRNVCAKLGCLVTPPRNIDQLQIETSTLTQSATPNQFDLAMSLHNRAPLALAWPSLEISLLDQNNQLVIRRVVSPAQYLPAGTDLNSGIGADTHQAVNLQLTASGTSPANYKVLIFYP